MYDTQKKSYEYRPLYPQTSSVQYNSCNQAPSSYTSGPMQNHKQDWILLEEIHRNCNNEEHSSLNGCGIPAVSKFTTNEASGLLKKEFE